MELAREAGFTHAKMIVHWPRLEPKRGRYTFQQTSENDLDNVMKAARNEGIKLVVRVDGVPDWTGGSPAKADPKEVEAFYAAMAAHGKGTIVGLRDPERAEPALRVGRRAEPGRVRRVHEGGLSGRQEG